MPYFVRSDSVSSSANQLNAARASKECIMKAGTMASCLLILTAATPPASAETLAWGGRAGMESTVVSKSGIDTASAVVKLKQNGEDVKRYCDYFLNADDIPKCVDDTLKAPQENTFTANCLTGEFSIYPGMSLHFLGPTATYAGNAKLPEYPPEYIIQDGEGKIRDQFLASGYSVFIEIFRALCPSRVQ